MSIDEMARWAKVEQMRVDVMQVCLEHLNGEAVLPADAMAQKILSIFTLPTEPSATAQALRMRSVWLSHLEKLRHFAGSSDTPKAHASYTTINRHTLVKGLKALIADMVKAERGEQ